MSIQRKIALFNKEVDFSGSNRDLIASKQKQSKMDDFEKNEKYNPKEVKLRQIVSSLGDTKDLREIIPEIKNQDNVIKIINKAALNFKDNDEYIKEDSFNKLNITKFIDANRPFIKFNNIEDSLSEADIEGHDYFDFVPKWYSIDPRSIISNLMEVSLQVHLILILIFYPIELAFLNRSSIIVILIHVYLELYIVSYTILKIITGIPDKRFKRINYNIKYVLYTKLKSTGIIFIAFEALLLIFNYLIILMIKYLFRLNNDQFILLLEVNIISKFLTIFFLSDWIDINSILKFSNYLALNMGTSKSSNKNSKMNNNSSNWQRLVTVVVGFKIFFYYFFLIHIAACVWIYIFQIEREQFESNNWAVRFKLSDTDSFTIYVASIYYCLTTLLSVGYGDIFPVNLNERLFIIFYTLLCAFLYSFLITLISFLYSKKETKMTLFFEKVNILKNIRDDYYLNDDLYKKIYDAIEHSAQDYKIDKLALIDSLPRSLKLGVQNYVFQKITNKIKYFSTIENEQFTFELCNLLKSQSHASKVYLLQPGFVLEEVFFIITGSLLISLSDDLDNYPISKIVMGETFGDHLLETKKVSPFSIKTNSQKNEIMSLSRDNFNKIKDKFPEEIEKCLKFTNFVYNLIEELRLGAITYYEVYGSLKNYRALSMSLVNNQINTELEGTMRTTFLQGKRNNIRGSILLNENKTTVNKQNLLQTNKVFDTKSIFRCSALIIEDKLKNKLKIRSLKQIINDRKSKLSNIKNDSLQFEIKKIKTFIEKSEEKKNTMYNKRFSLAFTDLTTNKMNGKTLHLEKAKLPGKLVYKEDTVYSVNNSMQMYFQSNFNNEERLIGSDYKERFSSNADISFTKRLKNRRAKKIFNFIINKHIKSTEIENIQAIQNIKESKVIFNQTQITKPAHNPITLVKEKENERSLTSSHMIGNKSNKSSIMIKNLEEAKTQDINLNMNSSFPNFTFEIAKNSKNNCPNMTKQKISKNDIFNESINSFPLIKLSKKLNEMKDDSIIKMHNAAKTRNSSIPLNKRIKNEIRSHNDLRIINKIPVANSTAIENNKTNKMKSNLILPNASNNIEAKSFLQSLRQDFQNYMISRKNNLTVSKLLMEIKEINSSSKKLDEFNRNYKLLYKIK